MNRIFSMGRRSGWALALAALAMSAAPAMAQVQTVDPDSAIDGDLAQTSPQGELPAVSGDPYAKPATKTDPYPVDPADPYLEPVAPASAPTAPAATPAPATTTATAASQETYQEDDLIGAAEGVFGKGAQGLADVIQDILKKQGQPNAYITGREAGGAIAIGVRYGSGTLHHKVEGTQPVYWTGPSIGFDAGANAASTFVLVYNLWDSEELFERFPAGEGQAYLVGGFNVSYMRKGDVVLIPVRVGAGLRLGVNAGYMKFSKKQRWLPF
ncbi:DUF1134 domain-containing protein [Croceicoccus sp. BE223]|uniref:DUF1134 domain-containing protein n=1 Tax=Croceicoccus sp. BE223 TaxID=2817716 RepID=UPI002856B251|nr:DUF1134 domain-containing protein [Croceicoccus sp. BE223]MDR7103835.1 hypothetical protein [Croceicoccus sp. BE223]